MSKWIAADAVRIIKKGGKKLVQILTNPSRRMKNISDGYMDANGVFHPIRWAGDYDPSAVGEGRRRRKATSKKRTAKKRKATTKKRRRSRR